MTDRPDLDGAPGLDDEFWGEQTEWIPRERPAERGGLMSAVGRWWDALLGGGAVAGRAHGPAAMPAHEVEDLDPRIGRPRTVDHDEVRDHDDDHLVLARADDDGDAWAHDDDVTAGDDAWTLEPEPPLRRHPGVDPLLARLGGLAVIVTLAAPLIVGFTGSDGDSQSADALATVSSGAASSQVAAPAEASAGGSPAVPASTATAPAAGSTSEAAPTSSPSTAPATDGDAEPTTSPAVAAALQDAPDDEPSTPPAATTPPCGARYELAAGDYWIRIADAASVSLEELLEVNDASVDTVLVPGRSICLPLGAATPTPPPTVTAATPTAPATTSAPNRSTVTNSTTSSSTTRSTTTAAPAPTTTVPARPAAVPQSQAAAIIREVWPDELEERALEIAWRESKHESNVNNWCCYGLFQIHWEAHRSWLSTLGITSVSQLYDPVLNATAAYALYQRSGGFGPWGG